MLSPSLEAHLQHGTADVVALAPAMPSNTLSLVAIIQDWRVPRAWCKHKHGIQQNYLDGT
jgi:hypothetical protein